MEDIKRKRLWQSLEYFQDQYRHTSSLIWCRKSCVSRLVKGDYKCVESFERKIHFKMFSGIGKENYDLQTDMSSFLCSWLIRLIRWTVKKRTPCNRDYSFDEAVRILYWREETAPSASLSRDWRNRFYHDDNVKSPQTISMMVELAVDIMSFLVL